MEQKATYLFLTVTVYDSEDSVSTGFYEWNLLQCVFLLPIFTLTYLLETFGQNTISLITEYLVFGTFLGAVVRLKWPGSNAHAILILSDLSAISRLLVLLAMIPIVSVVWVGYSRIITRLHYFSHNSQDATSSPGISVRFAIPSVSEIFRQTILPCMNVTVTALLPWLFRVADLTGRKLNTVYLLLSMAGPLIIETLTILSNAVLLEIAAKLNERLVLACSKSTLMENLKFSGVISPFGRLLNSIADKLKVPVHRQTPLITNTAVSLLKSSIPPMNSIYNMIADTIRVLYSIAGESSRRSTRLAIALPDRVLPFLTLPLQLGPQILLGCSEATTRIQTLAVVLGLGERFSTFIDAFPRTPMPSLALFLRHFAISIAGKTARYIEHLPTNAKRVLATACSTLAKLYFYAVLHLRNIWPAIDQSKVILYDLAKFVCSCALSSWHTVIMKLGRLTGFATGVSVSGSVNRTDPVFAYLLETSSRRLRTGALWSSAFIKGLAYRFVLPIYNGWHHQKCLIMWRAFRFNLAYILCVMVSYFLLLMIARYTSEKRASQIDALRKCSSIYRPGIAYSEILKTQEAAERQKCLGEETTPTTPDILEEECQKYITAPCFAAAVAHNFINCDGSEYPSYEKDKLCVPHVNELESESCKVEEYTQWYGLDAIPVEKRASRTPETNKKVRSTISYVFEVMNGLEAARLQLKKASTEIEDVGQMLATAQTHLFSKIGGNNEGQRLYEKLYDGDLDLIDFLSRPELTGKAHHTAQTQLLPLASLFPPFSVERDVYRTDESNRELDNDLYAVELTRGTVQREIDCDEIGSELQLDFENLPQSASTCRPHRPVRAVQGEKCSSIVCVESS